MVPRMRNFLMYYFFQLFLLDALLSEGFCPKVIRQGRRFKLLSIEELNIKIIPSYNYFLGNEFTIAHLFDLKFEEIFFPVSMLKAHNLNFLGKMPSLEMFLSKFDSPKSIEAKKKFYERRKANKKWSLLKELVIYSELKLQLLALSVLTFIKESMDFQEKLQINLKRTSHNFLNPFSGSIIFE